MRPLFQVASWFDPRRLFAAKPVRRGSARSLVHGLPTAGVVSECLEDRKYLSATIAEAPVEPLDETDEGNKQQDGQRCRAVDWLSIARVLCHLIERVGERQEEAQKLQLQLA